jgi:WD40 repeat protein
MAKAPEDRYESCRQFADALRDALGRVSYQPAPQAAQAMPATRATPATPGRRAGARRRRSSSRRKRYILAATAVLAAAAVTVGVLVKPAGPPALYVQIRAFTAPRPAGLWPFVSSVAFSPDGRTLATGLTTETLAGPDNSGTTYLWNVRTGKRLVTMASAGGPEAFSPNGRTLAAAGEVTAPAEGGELPNGRLSLWDIPAGQQTHIPDANQDAGIDGTAFSPDGKVLAANLNSGIVYLWTADPWRGLRILGGPGAATSTSVAFTPNGRTIVTGEDQDRVFLWNWATGRRIATLRCPGDMLITSVAVSRNGATIAASDQNGRTFLWDTAARSLTATLTDPHSFGVDAVAFSPDGKMLATGDSNGKTYLWNLPAGTLAATLTNPRGPVTSQLTGENRTAVFSVAFSPDGNTLVTSDTNGSAYLWRVG